MVTNKEGLFLIYIKKIVKEVLQAFQARKTTKNVHGHLGLFTTARFSQDPYNFLWAHILVLNIVHA